MCFDLILCVGDVEPLEKKEGQNKWVLSNTLSNRGRRTEETFQEVKVADSSLKVFTLEGLRNATRNFSDDMVVGEGAFGKVFKGWVEQKTYVPSKIGSGIPIAVKKLDTDSYQGFEEWQVIYLPSFVHQNCNKVYSNNNMQFCQL